MRLKRARSRAGRTSHWNMKVFKVKQQIRNALSCLYTIHGIENSSLRHALHERHLDGATCFCPCEKNEFRIPALSSGGVRSAMLTKPCDVPYHLLIILCRQATCKQPSSASIVFLRASCSWNSAGSRYPF
jgi:hypothetical protein